MLLPAGVVHSKPMGQQVPLTLLLFPHKSLGCTVLKHAGRLYWIPELSPAQACDAGHHAASMKARAHQNRTL